MPFLPLYFQAAWCERCRRNRDVVGPEPRRDAGTHRDARAILGTTRGSLRPKDHGRALARQFRRRHGSHGVRAASVARVCASRDAGALCRLRLADACRWRPIRRRATGWRTRSGSCRRRSGWGPPIGPIVGGVVAQIVGLRNAFLVTAVFLSRCGARRRVHVRRAAGAAHRDGRREGGRVTFRNMLAFENFILLMGGRLRTSVRRPQLRAGPAAVCDGAGYAGDASADRCRRVSFRLRPARALLDTISAGGCSGGLPRGVSSPAARRVGAAGAFVYVLARGPWLLLLGTPIFGVAIGVATTAAYTAASSVMPAQRAGCGVRAADHRVA